MSAKDRAVDVIRRAVGIEHDGLPLMADMHLYDDLAADSLTVLEIGELLERELDIVIPDFIAHQWRTVGDVLDAVAQAEAAA